MFKPDGTRANIVEHPVVGFSDNRVDGPHLLHSGLGQQPFDHRISRLPDAQSAGQQNGGFQFTQLPHLADAGEFAESIHHVDGGGDSLEVQVPGVGQNRGDSGVNRPPFAHGAVAHPNALNIGDRIERSRSQRANKDAGFPGARTHIGGLSLCKHRQPHQPAHRPDSEMESVLHRVTLRTPKSPASTTSRKSAPLF